MKANIAKWIFVGFVNVIVIVLIIALIVSFNVYETSNDDPVAVVYKKDCRRDIRVIADVSKEDLSRDVMQKFIATMASSMRKEHTFLAYPYNVRKPNTVDIVKDYSRHSKLEENVKKGLSVTAHERRAEEILLLLTDSLITEDAVKLLKARVPQPLLIEVNGVQKNRTVADVPADVFPQLNDALDFAVLKIKYLMPNC